MRKFRGAFASGQRPQGNSNASGHDPGDILLEPPDIRVGGSSVVPLAGMPVLGTEPDPQIRSLALTIDYIDDFCKPPSF
jgi:hypothetical protein